MRKTRKAWEGNESKYVVRVRGSSVWDRGLIRLLVTDICVRMPREDSRVITGRDFKEGIWIHGDSNYYVDFSLDSCGGYLHCYASGRHWLKETLNTQSPLTTRNQGTTTGDLSYM